jgi:hypothetical protein
MVPPAWLLPVTLGMLGSDGRRRDPYAFFREPKHKRDERRRRKRRIQKDSRRRNRR